MNRRGGSIYPEPHCVRGEREVAPACPRSLRPGSRPASLSRVDPELCAFGLLASPPRLKAGVVRPTAQWSSRSSGVSAARFVNCVVPTSLMRCVYVCGQDRPTLCWSSLGAAARRRLAAGQQEARREDRLHPIPTGMHPIILVLRTDPDRMALLHEHSQPGGEMPSLPKSGVFDASYV